MKTDSISVGFFNIAYAHDKVPLSVVHLQTQDNF